MADTLASTLAASLRWDRVEALDLSSVQDQATLSYSQSLADGTSASQADIIWHDTRTVSAAANDDLDLTALTQSIYGTNVSTNFVKVKAILIVITTATTGYYLRIDSSVTNGFNSITGGASGKIEFGANSPLTIARIVDGWSTSGTNKVLRITNPSAGSVTYKIAIIGTSA